MVLPGRPADGSLSVIVDIVVLHSHPVLAALPSIALSQAIILPLTWATLRALHVPERHELVAGIFLTIVYALVVSSLARLVLG